MAELDSIAEVVSEVVCGSRAVDGLAYLAALADATALESVADVLTYVGGKLKRDGELLDELFSAYKWERSPVNPKNAVEGAGFPMAPLEAEDANA